MESTYLKFTTVKMSGNKKQHKQKQFTWRGTMPDPAISLFCLFSLYGYQKGEKGVALPHAEQWLDWINQKGSISNFDVFNFINIPMNLPF